MKLLPQLARFQFALAAGIVRSQPVQFHSEQRSVSHADTGECEEGLAGEIEVLRRGQIAPVTALVEDIVVDQNTQPPPRKPGQRVYHGLAADALSSRSTASALEAALCNAAQSLGGLPSSSIPLKTL